MAFSISKSSIEDLKNQVNIVDVISRAVPLKRAGSNFKGVCPFHREKTPSFVVSQQKQFFTCFGCGAKGDVIGFVEQYYNLDFTEAVEKIAQEQGIELQKSSYDNNREKYYQVNQLAARFFYKNFTEKANKGYAYMKGRNISPEILKKFGIGYADESWDSLYRYLLSQNVDEKTMMELGLISYSKGKYYDKFRNRVIFPIINTGGKVIGFGGRAIFSEDNPKYLNSPESKVFQKKNNLYGLNISRQNVGKEGKIILVEGYMDVISLYQGGVENVAASLGTALTENQAKLVKRYTKNVVLSYDADSAGRAAALRGIEILAGAGCNVKVLHVTDGKDPDEFIKKKGKKAFLDLVNHASPYGEYKLSTAAIGFDLSKDEDRSEYMKKAVEILKGLSPVDQDIYIERLEKQNKISKNAIIRQLSDTNNQDSAEHVPREFSSEKKENDEISPIDKTIIKIMVTNDNLLDLIQAHKEDIESDLGHKILDLVTKAKAANNYYNADDILDKLTIEESAQMSDILENVFTGGNPEEVLNECFTSYKRIQLEKVEQELIDQISLADDDTSTEMIKQITDKLKEVQLKKSKLQMGESNEQYTK